MTTSSAPSTASTATAVPLLPATADPMLFGHAIQEAGPAASRAVKQRKRRRRGTSVRAGLEVTLEARRVCRRGGGVLRQAESAGEVEGDSRFSSTWIAAERCMHRRHI